MKRSLILSLCLAILGCQGTYELRAYGEASWRQGSPPRSSRTGGRSAFRSSWSRSVRCRSMAGLKDQFADAELWALVDQVHAFEHGQR